jgi:Zn-dependent oligopeptidase
MSLRFRVSDQSALGRRLLSIDESRRKSLFDQIVEAGLTAADARFDSDTRERLSGTIEMLEQIVRRLDQMATRIEALAGAHPSMSLHSTESDESISNRELETLMTTLGGLGGQVKYRYRAGHDG